MSRQSSVLLESSIKSVSAHAAQLEILFPFTLFSVELHLLQGPYLCPSTDLLESKVPRIEDEEIRKKEGRNRTHDLKSLCSRDVCATAVLQPPPKDRVDSFGASN